MKMKAKKQGFTLVEIMIVVAIIGLLAAIGIPSILNAYKTSQVKAKASNVTEVEKAKGVLTLPTDSGLLGAIALTNTTVNLGAGTYATALCDALRLDSLDELTIDGTAITVETLETKAHY